MSLLMAVVTLLLPTLSAAFRTTQPLLASAANWHFFPLTYEADEQFLLFELIRYSEDGSRSFLTADFDTSPIEVMNRTSRLWSTSSEFADIELWAHHLSYGFVQVPKGRNSV